MRIIRPKKKKTEKKYNENNQNTQAAHGHSKLLVQSVTGTDSHFLCKDAAGDELGSLSLLKTSCLGIRGFFYYTFITCKKTGDKDWRCYIYE